jgi:hypothetical protein
MKIDTELVELDFKALIKFLEDVKKSFSQVTS